MTIKFDKNILKNYGIADMKDFELLEVLNSKLYFLLTHNKNYTKQQYYELQDIAEIIRAICTNKNESKEVTNDNY